MAGTTSSIISNLLSSLERLSRFMPMFISLGASSSSSIAQEEVNVAEVYSIQKRLMEDLSRLSRMLQRIQATLYDVEERENTEKAIQLWLSELREVAYDTEDILDQYDYQVIKTQLEGMTVVVEAEPSLKGKRVDANDDDVYGYQDRTALMAMLEDWESDDSSSEEVSFDSASDISDEECIQCQLQPRFDDFMWKRNLMTTLETRYVYENEIHILENSNTNSNALQDFDDNHVYKESNDNSSDKDYGDIVGYNDFDPEPAIALAKLYFGRGCVVVHITFPK